MRFSITALLLAATFSSTLATPLPSDFNDIERRWSQGQSEAQIHSAHSVRDLATPAWPVLRAAEVEEVMDPDAFESTTDERTMVERSRSRSRFHKRSDDTTVAKMRQFVEAFMRSKGETGMIGARAESVEEAPVLKPRKGTPMRYRFTA
ncbi:hypothetical protein LTR08_008061 [Meristemomyces frigidus]|nr:hypothetical protein LTR08_008061 [Meristemomyces frigidus]